MASIAHAFSRNLQCPICLCVLRDPKELDCSHTFCQKCLTNTLRCSSRVNEIKCAICRDTTRVLNGNVVNLRTNLPLKRLVDDVIHSRQICDMCVEAGESIRAIEYCCECGKNMCTDCLQRHNTWKPNLNHQVVKVEDIREGRVVLEKKVCCQEEVHKSDKLEEVCTDVCITCKKLICTRCRMLYHEKKGHTLQDTGEYAAFIKAKIESIQATGNEKATTMKEDVAFVERQTQLVNDYISRRKNSINEICQESINKLNERTAELHAQLDTLKDEFCRKLDEIKIADEKLVTNIESSGKLAGDSLNAPLEGDVVTIRDFLSSELEDAVKKGRDHPRREGLRI